MSIFSHLRNQRRKKSQIKCSKSRKENDQWREAYLICKNHSRLLYKYIVCWVFYNTSNMYVCSWCQLGSPGEGWMTKKGKRIEETTEERIQEVQPWSCNVTNLAASCKLCSLKHHGAGLCPPPNLHGYTLWQKTNKSDIIWLYTFFMHPFKCLRASLPCPCIAYPPIMAFQNLASCWTLSEHHPGFHISHTCLPSYSPQKLPDSQTLWRISSWAHLPPSSAPGLAHAWTAPVQNKQSLNAHLRVAFVEIVPMPVSLAGISHIPIS